MVCRHCQRGSSNVASPMLRRPMPGFGADHEATRRDNKQNYDKEMVCALYLIPFDAFAYHSFSQLGSILCSAKADERPFCRSLASLRQIRSAELHWSTAIFCASGLLHLKQACYIRTRFCLAVNSYVAHELYVICAMMAAK